MRIGKNGKQPNFLMTKIYLHVRIRLRILKHMNITSCFVRKEMNININLKKECSVQVQKSGITQHSMSTISTCPNFQKTEECTMSKPLYSGQGYLNKSEALGLKIY